MNGLDKKIIHNKTVTLLIKIFNQMLIDKIQNENSHNVKILNEICEKNTP